MDPILPVYLVHWNSPEWCCSAVNSILQSTGVDVEVTVIDNGQLVGPPLEQLLPSSVRIVRMANNVGYTGGANVGLIDFLTSSHHASHCVVGSHDLHVEPTTLFTLLTTAQRYPEYGILGPWFTAGINAQDGPYSRVRGTRGVRFSDGPVGERTWVTGAGLLLSRECVEAIGGFDFRLGSYVEDVDICLRAWDAGLKVGCVVEARASGLGSVSTIADSTCLIDVNNAVVVAKRGGWPLVAASVVVTGYYFGRSVASSLVPWRSSARRQVSREYARGHGRALSRMARQHSRFRSVIADPDCGHQLDVQQA